MKLKVLIHPEAEGGFSAAVPALPGCYTCGETLDEVRANVKEAVLGYLEAADGQNPFPPEHRDVKDWVEEIEL